MDAQREAQGIAGSEVLSDRALSRAMKLLAVRGRSRHEVTKRLIGAGFTPAVVDAVELRLVELGLLDDSAFAQECARQALAAGKSRDWIRADLAQRGLSSSVIEETISVVGAENDDDQERAFALARKRALSFGDLPPAKAYQRITRYLCQKGYGPELAGDVARRVIGDPDGWGSD